jgi:hypothetical protein
VIVAQLRILILRGNPLLDRRHLRDRSASFTPRRKRAITS